MGFLADIYVSSDEAAVGYNIDPDRFADRARFKNITPLELSTLWAIIRGVEWHLALLDEFPCVLQLDGGARLIHRLPDALMVALSKLAAEQANAVAAVWAATEELKWSTDEAREVIDEAVRLSRTASETGRRVFLWNCI